MIRFLPLLLSLLCFGTAFAQDPADAHAADRAALRELGSRYEAAINHGDLRPLAPFVAPTASAVFATNHEVQGLEGMQQYFDSMKERLGKNSSYTVKLEPDRTEFFGDIAIAHGRSAENARLGNGDEYRFTTRWTAVLHKDPDGWKALRLHVSMDPLDNPVIAARLKARTWMIAALGVLVAGVAFATGRVARAQRKGA